MRIFGFLLAFALALPFTSKAQVNGVTVEIALDQEHFLPDEDVMVMIKIVNRSGQTLELGGDPTWLNFSIQGDLSIVVQKGEIPIIPAFSLKSGQTETRQFNLTPYFSFRQQGNYSLVAAVKIPQWGQTATSKAVAFSVMNGVPVANMPDLQFGVPPREGTVGSVPEVRKYVLEKAIYLKEPRLYFRLTDAAGGKTFRVYCVGPIVSFSQPDTKIDGESNLHLIYQFYAKSFCYCVINPDGRLLVRQIHDYSQSRPTLRMDAEGRVYVAGGVRKYTPSDLPLPIAATFTSTNSAALTNSDSQ